MVDIVHAKSEADIARARRLFVELITCFDFAALFQGVQNELEDSPSTYMPPEGCLLFAVVDMQIVGCSAMKRIDEHTCELKRLCILPGFRRRGIGTALTKAVIDEAGTLGYTTMHLNTLPSMKDAIALYSGLGFTPVEPKEHDRKTKAVYMELALKNHGI